MPSDGPAPGPQNLLHEEVLRSEVGDLQCMNSHVVDDACCCQHGVVKDRGEAGTAWAKDGPVPPPNRGREREGDGSTMQNVLDGVSFLTTAKLAGAKATLEASSSEEAVADDADRGQHNVGLQ